MSKFVLTTQIQLSYPAARQRTGPRRHQAHPPAPNDLHALPARPESARRMRSERRLLARVRHCSCHGRVAIHQASATRCDAAGVDGLITGRLHGCAVSCRLIRPELGSLLDAAEQLLAAGHQAQPHRPR
jgi:hypothetical protein